MIPTHYTDTKYPEALACVRSAPHSISIALIRAKLGIEDRRAYWLLMALVCNGVVLKDGGKYLLK